MLTCISIVDGSTAGSGNLEILVNGGHVTSYVRELGDQCFLASFVPHQATVHTIEVITRNNKSITRPTSVETCNCFVVNLLLAIISHCLFFF